MNFQNKQHLHQAVRDADILHGIFGGDRHAALPAGATNDLQAVQEHVMGILALYARMAGRSSASQLLKAAAPLLSVSCLQATALCTWVACAALRNAPCPVEYIAINAMSIR